MTPGSPCGQARMQLVSRYPHTATGQAGAWEQAYPGTADQLRHLRAALRMLLRDCPVADDVILVLHELAANAVRHSKSRERGGTFTVRLLNVPGEYVLGEVEDGGSNWDGDLQGSARDASGLYLVLNLASACDASGDGRKRLVWFRVHYPSGHHGPMSPEATSG